MFGLSLLSDAHIEPLADGVLEVLERVGVYCQNQEILRALEGVGAVVDYEAEQVRFPRGLVVEYVESFRREGSTEPGSGHVSFRPPGLPGLGTQVAQIYYDWPAGERRQGNTRDFIELIKFGDVLHDRGPVGHCLLLTDVPPILEPLEAAMLLAEYAHSPAPAFAWNVAQVDYLIEMGEILGLHRWFSWGAICFAHPLRFDKDVADKFVRRVREGVPTGLTAMPVAGLTTPITVEGFIVVSSAEHVATWIAARAINPDVPLTGSTWGGTMDMRTGHVSYSAFDALYYTFASVEFLRRWCGITVAASGGDYCDAREPGLYAALEKAYKAMTIAAFTGRHPAPGAGMLEEGRTLCPVQLMLEREFAAALHQFARQVDPTPENIAMPAILEVGPGLTANYLSTDHTLENFRRAAWLPELIDRSGWNGFEHEEAMLRAAQAKVDDMVARYEKPQGREEQLRAMRAVVDRAKRDLLER